MKSFNLCFILIVMAIGLQSCGGARQASQLKWHQSYLSRIAHADLGPEAKLDSMAISFIDMMNEGLKIVNPKKGAQYVERYAKQNDASIDLILKELDAWQADLTPLEKIGYGVKLAGKPYARDLVGVFRKFEKKYKQAKLIMSLSRKVKNGLLSAGLKSLGLGG
ncbi:MAG: hypothetical protein KTR24_09925 [Saprospiraceae bacterium]|nr:hypothetical protein [Saprospiraceae bacterium]